MKKFLYFFLLSLLTASGLWGQSTLNNYGAFNSVNLNYAPTGAGGWSAPGGVILGGGFRHYASGTVRANFPAEPNGVYPHYTYGPNEYGWNVYNGGTAGVITIHGLHADLPPGYGIIKQTINGFSQNGWAGWSVPAGKVVLGGGYEANGPVQVSAPAGPNTVWPHYTYGNNEYGWVVQSAGATSITIYAIYADMPDGYEIVKSSQLNFSGNGWAGWSVSPVVGKVVTGGGFQLPGPASASLPWLPGQTTPFGYTYQPYEYGWVVQNGGTAGAGFIYAIYANRTLLPVTLYSSDGTLKSDHTSIQAAINAAVAGDRIEVGAGTYNEDVNVNKAVELRGANYDVCYDDVNRGAESTIAGLVTVSASGASLDGFRLTKRSTSTTSNGINFSNWSGVSLNVTGVNTGIRNNIIEMYGGAGGTDNAVILNAAGAVTFECNEVIGGAGYTAELDGRGVSALRLTNTASDYSISGNHFGVSSGRNAGGVDADAVSFFNVGDADFDGNLVDGNIMGGVVIFGAVDDVTISNNTIKDYTAALAGIRVFNCCDYNSATADVTITGNFVEGTTGTTGIAFRNDPIPAADVLDISSNSITGNTTAIDFNGTGSPLDATCNWYGTTDVTAIAAAMSGSITYQPFLGSGVDANPAAAGFQPSSASQPGYVTAVAGNGQPISNGSTTYSATNLTLMGSAPVGGSIVRNYSFTSATSCGASNGANFTSLSFTGPGAARFSFGGVVTGTAYAPGTHNFTIAYTAHTAPIEDEVTCVMATASGAYTFKLKAVTTPPSPAVAQISGNSVLISNGDFSPNTSDHTDFGSIAAPGTLTRTYTITNAGPTGCLPLTLTPGTPITFVGGQASKFAVTPNTCTAPLASGASCTFTVTYTSGPTGGISNTMIRVANSDPARNPYEYSIRAELLSPSISVTGNNTSIANGDNTPVAADHTLMGSAVSGQTITRSYTLKNLGLGNLIIGATAVALSAADNGPGHTNFAVATQPAEGVYTTNQEAFFSITFTSPGQGQYYALVTLTTQNAGTFTFVVQGTGPSPRMQVVGNNVDIPTGSTTVATTNHTDFGTRTLNTNFDRTFTVRNPSSLGAAAPLNLTGSQRVTENSDMFSVALQPGSPIDVNGSTTFRIRYRPTAAGCHWAQISIASNDPDRNPYTFVVRGNTAGQSCGPNYPASMPVQEDVDLLTTDRMDEQDALKEIALYPNPATDVVLMEVPVSAESRIISFINVSGVTVYSIDTKGGFHSIDLAGFAPGVYAVVSSDRSLAPKRFVKL